MDVGLLAKGMTWVYKVGSLRLRSDQFVAARNDGLLPLRTAPTTIRGTTMVEIKDVVVFVDGRREGSGFIEFAARLAQEHGAHLTGASSGLPWRTRALRLTCGAVRWRS